MSVSRDKYELPEAAADSVGELAEICGVSPNSILSYISHAKHKGWKRCKYVKVEEEDDGEI